MEAVYWKFNLDPAIFRMGPIEIRWYGLMYVLGMVLTYLLMKHYFIKKGTLKLSNELLDSLITYIFIGMLLGARLFYIIFYNLPYYMDNPSEMIAFWHGGLSFHGAVVGISLAIYIFAIKNSLSFLNLMDHISFCAAIGVGFGRIGNFINGELWGRVTKVSWAVIFPNAGPLPRHPSQLYESFFEGFLLASILFFVLLKQKRAGSTYFMSILLYGVFRFFIEYFREPDAQLGTIFLGLSMGQLLCMAMVLVALICFKTRNKLYY